MTIEGRGFLLRLLGRAAALLAGAALWPPARRGLAATARPPCGVRGCNAAPRRQHSTRSRAAGSLVASLLWTASAFGQAIEIDADNKVDRAFGLGVADASPAAAAIGPAGAELFGLATPLAVNPQLGNATTSIPLVIPPGRKNATPDLRIRYSSSAPNGPFGIGWDFSLGSVRRDTRQGVPINQTSGAYDDAYGFVLTFPRGTVLLDRCLDAVAPSLCTRWTSQVEDVWVEAQFDRGANLWRVKDKGGMQYTFGGIAAAHTGFNVTDDAGTFGWELVKIEDPNTNRIAVQYTAPDLASGENPYSYLDQIDYGGNIAAGYTDLFHVKVSYVTGRPDTPISYKGGYRSQVTRRAESIKVWADVPPYGSANPIRTYQFTYDQDPDTQVSQLHTVHLIVPDEPSPPDTTFTYESKPNGFNGVVDAIFDFMPTAKARAVLQQFETGPARVKSGFIDVNGDRLPDFLDGYSGNEQAGLVLYLNRGGYRFERQNNGNVWTSRTHRISYDGGSTDFIRLLDMTGDGLPDLVTEGNCPATGNPATTCSWYVYPNSGGQLSTTAVEWKGVPTTLLGKFPNPIQPQSASSRQAQLVDLDGDGLPDLLHCNAWSAASPYCNFHRNIGTSVVGGVVGGDFASPTSWYVPDIAAVWFDDPQNKLTATGSLWDTLRWGPLAAKVGDGVSSQGNGGLCGFDWVYAYHLLKTIADVNGDGLPDLVSNGEPEQLCCSVHENYANCCMPGECGTRSTYANAHSNAPWDVAFNTGAGFADPVPWYGTENRLDPLYLDFTSKAIGGTARILQDLNGDGLPDYLIHAGSNLDWKVAFNAGDRFMGDPSNRGSWLNVGNNTALIDKSNGSNTYDGKIRSMPVDIDGDGIVDRLTVVGTASLFFQVRPGKPPRANLLRRVDNGVGGSWEAAYSAAAQPDATLPFPVWTVDTVTARSGQSGTGHTLTTAYAFSGGYFDVTAREFRGFEESIETRTADGRTATRVFAAPYAPGSNTTVLALAPFRLVSEEIRDGAAKLLSRTTSTWGSVTVANPAGDRQRMHPLSTTRNIFGATESSRTTQTRAFDTYDDYNNVKNVTVSGSVVRGSEAATSTTLSKTTLTYTTDVVKAILDRPRTVVVKDAAGTTLSSREYLYDANGNLTDVLDWLDTDPFNAAGGSRTVTSLSFLYETGVDAAAKTGLPTTVRTAWGNAQSATTTVRYACSSGLYPCTVTNDPSFGHVTTYAYDLAFGRALSVTDPNNAVTTYDYDGYGRLRSVTEPLDPVSASDPNGAQRAAVIYQYQPGSATAPGYIRTQVREPGNGSGYSTSVEFFDGLGRRLARKTENEVNGVSEATVSEAVELDTVGRVFHRLVPYAGSASYTTYDPPAAGAAATELTYDGLDRVRVSKGPDGNTAETLYDLGGGIESRDENYTKCVEDPNATNASCPGGKTVDLYDPFGRLVESTLYQGASTIIRTTVTAYDPLHRMKSTTTTNGSGTTGNSQITYAYDSLGRRLTMTENDSGTWNYAYDDAGNLVSQDDPRTASHVEVCYDQLDRPVNESWVSNDTFSRNSCGQSGNLGSFAYDGATNGKGRLWEALGPRTGILNASPITAATTRVFEYDKRGREVQVRKTLVLTAGSSRAFTWNFTYNAADQVTKVNYPTESADEELVLLYNSVGRARSALTFGNMYVFSTVYDRFGRMTTQQLADGAAQNQWVYSTDPLKNFRLEKIAASTPVGTVQDFRYSAYDRAGNLLTIDDQTPSSPPLQAPATQYGSSSPRDNDWTYSYWGEGRLKSSRKGPNGTTASFFYDYLDNMTLGNLGFPDPTTLQVMWVDSTKPHRMAALTPATPNAAPTYHNDGGLKSRPATVTGDLGKNQVDYDALGRVERVLMSDGAEVEYAYDHTGEVVARVINNSDVTLYYDGLFEVRGSTLTRHVYMEGQRVAFSEATAPPGLTLASLSDEERATMLARAAGGSGGGAFGARPDVFLAGIAATAGLGFLALLYWAPGPVRLSFFGRARRGWVAGLCIVLSGDVLVPPAALQWLDLGPAAAEASCTGEGGATTYPAYFVHPDHLGSAAALTTSRVPGVNNGTPVEYYRYGAFGKPQAYAAGGAAITAGNEKTDILFTGQTWDSRAQLHRFPARFYDPQVARFLSLDAIGGGTNPYGYVQWNPVNRIDPTGLIDVRFECSSSSSASWCGGVGGGYGTGIGVTPWLGSFFPDSRPEREVSFTDRVDSVLQSTHGHFESRAALNWSNGAYAGYAVDLVALAILPPDLRTLQFDLVLTVVTAGAGKVALSAVRGVRAVRTSLRVASSGVDVAEASIVRTITHGEKITDIIEKAKGLTFSTGNEYALISLRSGERVLVSGGPGGIDLSRLPVRRILGHTHPFQLLPTGPSLVDRAALQTLGQRSSYLFERGRQIRFGAGG